MRIAIINSRCADSVCPTTALLKSRLSGIPIFRSVTSNISCMLDINGEVSSALLLSGVNGTERAPAAERH